MQEKDSVEIRRKAKEYPALCYCCCCAFLVEVDMDGFSNKAHVFGPSSFFVAFFPSLLGY
jgi:predicted nucleic acid-binding Zn finger protein